MVPGSAPAFGGASRPTYRKFHRPAAAYFSTQPAGARAGAPEAGALPETMALSRYWRGGMTPASVVRLGSDAASRVDSVAELGTSFDDGLRGLARDGRWLFFIDTTHHHIQI